MAPPMMNLCASGRCPTKNLETPTSAQLGQTRKLLRVVTSSAVAAPICAIVRALHCGSRNVTKSLAVAFTSRARPNGLESSSLRAGAGGWTFSICWDRAIGESRSTSTTRTTSTCQQVCLMVTLYFGQSVKPMPAGTRSFIARFIIRQVNLEDQPGRVSPILRRCCGMPGWP